MSYRSREAGEDSFATRMNIAKFRGSEERFRRTCQHGGGIMFHSYRCALEDAFGDGAADFTFAPEASGTPQTGKTDWLHLGEPQVAASPSLALCEAQASGFGKRVFADLLRRQSEPVPF